MHAAALIRDPGLNARGDKLRSADQATHRTERIAYPNVTVQCGYRGERARRGESIPLVFGDVRGDAELRLSDAPGRAREFAPCKGVPYLNLDIFELPKLEH
jgi:hypothetical protein